MQGVQNPIHVVMAEDKERTSPRKATLEVLERMLAQADKLGVDITKIGVSALALHMEGNSFQKIATLLGITRSSAETLVHRGLYELRCLGESLAHVIDENNRLKEVNEEYILLRQAVGSEDADFLIRKQRLNNKIKAGLIDEKLLERLSISIYELGFSTRVSNSLRAGGKLTLGDIIKCKRSEFERYRNLGAKGLAEIDKAIADAGLTYEYEL